MEIGGAILISVILVLLFSYNDTFIYDVPPGLSTKGIIFIIILLLVYNWKFFLLF